MDAYVNALCGDAPVKPHRMDEHLRWRGEDDYMRGVYENPSQDASYYYGFRMAHSNWQQYVQEVQAARQAESQARMSDLSSNVLQFRLRANGDGA